MCHSLLWKPEIRSIPPASSIERGVVTGLGSNTQVHEDTQCGATSQPQLLARLLSGEPLEVADGA